MGKRTCTFPDCVNAHYSHGLCGGHNAQRKRGQALRPLRRMHPCAAEGCDRFVMVKWCKLHGERVARLGTPELPPRPTLADRFWAKVDKTADCWIWTGASSNGGYGQIFYEGRVTQAYRVSVVLSGRQIPDGYDVDHLCRNPPCVNPDHLEPVTHTVNMDRALSSAIQFQAAKTHCPQGHEYTPANTKLRRNRAGTMSRLCKECCADNQRRRRARKKAMRS